MIDLRVLAVITFIICIVLLYVSLPILAQTKIGIGSEFLGEVPQLIGTVRFGVLGTKVGIGRIKAAVTFSADGRFYFSLGKFFPLDLYVGAGIVIVKPPTRSFTGFNLMSGIKFPLHLLNLPFTAFGGLNYLDFGNVESTEVKGPGTHLGITLEF